MKSVAHVARMLDGADLFNGVLRHAAEQSGGLAAEHATDDDRELAGRAHAWCHNLAVGGEFRCRKLTHSIRLRRLWRQFDTFEEQ